MSGFTTSNVLEKVLKIEKLWKITKKTYKRMKIFDFEQFLYIQSNGKNIPLTTGGQARKF